MALYLVLSTIPKTAPTGEVSKDRLTGTTLRWHKVTTWPELGLLEAKNICAALAAAKQKWGGSPVVAVLDHLH
jgi:hypothetical protein